MLEKLKQRWKVNGIDLLLIICTFALGGSTCAYISRKLLGITGLEKDFFWFLIYIVLITLLWPVCVLLISIPLGQFSFFRRYLYKVWGRMTGKKKEPVSIALFASGAGSNAQKIIDHFRDSVIAKISLIVSNKPNAGVIAIAKKENIPVLLINKERFFEEDAYLPEMQKHGIGFIVLAGFLWKIPSTLIKTYPGKIVNIHPALLPKYGGKGMYGQHVHEAVIAAADKESGITIHYIDELYDHGPAIEQVKCPVGENDNASSLAEKIHQLEHLHYAPTIERLIKMQNPS